MKKALLLLFVLLFSASLSFASSNFTISVTDSLVINASQTGYVDINATSVANDRLLLSIVSEKPWMTLEDTQLIISAGATKSTKLYFSPTMSTLSGTYKFTVVVESKNTGETERADIFITVLENDFPVKIDRVAVMGSLEPSGTARMEIYVKNTGTTANDAQVDALITSPSNRKVYELHEVAAVDPNEKKIISRDFYLGNCAEYGEYSIQMNLTYKGYLADSFVQRFDVIKKPNVEVETSEQGIVTYEKTYVIKNTGNEAGNAEVSEKVFGSIFYAGSEPSRIENGIYVWDVDISPCEQKTVVYRMNYSPIVGVLAALLALWYVVFKFRTIRIRKNILQIKHIEQGSEFTVGIDLKAYIGAKNVVIRDFVPSAFEVKETKGLKPHKTKTEAGTELLWKFDELKRNEERILDYKIVPIFGVRGRIRLPRAGATFNYFARRLEKRSPPVGLGMKWQESSGIQQIFSKKIDEPKKIKLKKKKERPFPEYSGFSLGNLFKKKELEEVELVDEGNK